MHPNPRLVAFDVDGTLLTSSHTILPSTKEAIAQLVQKGYRILLATARPPRSVAGIAAKLGLEKATFVALNGATIVDSQEIIWEMPLERNSIRPLILEARRRGLHANSMAGWDWFIESTSHWCEKEAAIVGFQPKMVSDLLEPSLPLAHKILAMGDAPTIADFRQWAIDLGLPLHVSLSKPNYCEIVHERVSKASALKAVAKMLQIPLANVIAFGDGENDKELVEMAGTGVAMGNSMPEVLAVADFVTRSNDDHGIYHALIELELIPC